MASQRYSSDQIAVNNTKMYKKYLEDSRGLTRGLSHFRTQTFRYPTQQQLSTLITTPYTWKVGDRFSKIAHKFYGDVELWWVIAMFNSTPTEAHVVKGDVIYIPQPVDRVIEMFTDNEETY